MPKRFIRISLAVKFRLLFGLALLGVIASALAVPWYFMEVLSEQGLERSARELTQLRLNEWTRKHPKNLKAASDANSDVIALYTSGREFMGLAGPAMLVLDPQKPFAGLDKSSAKALGALLDNTDRQIAWQQSKSDRGKRVYRCFLAVRNTTRCGRCHNDPAKPTRLQFGPGQLVGMIDVTLPGEASASADRLMWWTRGAFVAGGILAGILATVIFAIISHRLVLRPVRQLRELADKVTDGDQSVRSTVSTGDELQRLGESFNEMLQAIQTQHKELRSANRALDLKLNELGEVNVALYEANRVKTEFLANVSHELRTPLNSIIGFADLLRTSGEKRTARYGENITTASKNLLAMINDMLDLAKIEAGKVAVRADRVSVLDTCQTLLALMGPLADKRNVALLGELSEDLPIVVTDGGKLQQILYNLLSNAIKFTPPGGSVTLRASFRQGGNGNGQSTGEVMIAVEDTGPGISEADQSRIFDKFYQIDPTLMKETAGTGLGLAICKELANLLGGKITLRSSPGNGATFMLHLPLEQQ
ncbi:MAG: hypothetical protein DRP83_05730 [Planctomycetota bacterium]|nr:MAG: hypothetical protein DRP83_05730 [Planctomycetota bacterium]